MREKCFYLKFLSKAKARKVYWNSTISIKQIYQTTIYRPYILQKEIKMTNKEMSFLYTNQILEEK